MATKKMYKPSALEVYPNDGKYGSRQVIITGDRLLFNAKTDSAFITSQESISLSTNGNIHLDTLYESDKKIILSSPNIVLGLTSTYQEPADYAVRGIVLMDTLEKILDLIKIIVLDISTLDYADGNGNPVDAQDQDILENIKTADALIAMIQKGEFLSPRVKIS
jgi:hypothetical protein